MLKITRGWLKGRSACPEGIDWFNDQKKTDAVKVLEKLVAEDKLNWANWLIVRVMGGIMGRDKGYRMYVSYAVFATEQVIDIYEKKYPEDKHSRQAIEAAKKCIEDPSTENKKAAASAASAAYAASAASAADAAYAADAASAAADAAYAAADAAYAASAIKKKILEYGIKLLKENL